MYILCIHTYPIQNNTIYFIKSGIYKKYCIAEPLTEWTTKPTYLLQKLLNNFYYDYFSDLKKNKASPTWTKTTTHSLTA